MIVTTTDYVRFPWDRDLEITPLGTDPVVLVLPPDHPLTRRKVVDLAACATETWACDRPGSYMAELTERDVVVLTDTDPAAEGPLRQELRPRDFGVVLIDLDGTVAQRRPAPTTAREIINLIDRMPSRRQETGSRRQ